MVASVVIFVDLRIEMCVIMRTEERMVVKAKHTLGLDHKKPYKRHGRLFYRPYRNYYCGTDKVMDELVADGYADVTEENGKYGRSYCVNEKGREWLGEVIQIHIYAEED